jgi:hypothetical protein
VATSICNISYWVFHVEDVLTKDRRKFARMVEFDFLGYSKDMFMVFEVAVTKDVMKTKRVNECHILTCRGCGKGWYMREIGGIIMKGTEKPT